MSQSWPNHHITSSLRLNDVRVVYGAHQAAVFFKQYYVSLLKLNHPTQSKFHDHSNKD